MSFWLLSSAAVSTANPDDPDTFFTLDRLPLADTVGKALLISVGFRDTAHDSTDTVSPDVPRI